VDVDEAGSQREAGAVDLLAAALPDASDRGDASAAQRDVAAPRLFSAAVDDQRVTHDQIGHAAF
jgi:hypothetical protein